MERGKTAMGRVAGGNFAVSLPAGDRAGVGLGVQRNPVRPLPAALHTRPARRLGGGAERADMAGPQ